MVSYIHNEWGFLQNECALHEPDFKKRFNLLCVSNNKDSANFHNI